jgi:hypothetical protein
MKVTEKDLRQRYESLQDEELLDLYANNELNIRRKETIWIGLFFHIYFDLYENPELTETARLVLMEVLSSRGITKDRLNVYVTERQERMLMSGICFRGTIVDLELNGYSTSLTLIIKVLRTYDPRRRPFLELERGIFYNIIRGMEDYYMELECHFLRKCKFYKHSNLPRLIAFILKDHRAITSQRDGFLHRTNELFARISLGDDVHIEGFDQSTGKFSFLIFRKGKKRIINISSDFGQSDHDSPSEFFCPAVTHIFQNFRKLSFAKTAKKTN